MIRISSNSASTLGTLVLAAAIAIAGCGDTAQPTPVEVPRDMSPLSGNVTSIEDGLPIRSAEVILVDGRSYTVADGPVKTDADGHYSFPDPPVGAYYVFVFHSDFIIFDRSTPGVTISSGTQVQYDVRMMRPELWDSRGYRITGIVRDGATRAPIAGAFVSGFDGLLSHSFLGVSFPNESITGEDGTFVLEAVGVIPGEALYPFAVSKEGYQPFMSQPFPIPAAPDSVVDGVEVLLAPEEPPAASLRGRVFYEGSPVAGIRVALDFYDPSWQDNLPGVNPPPLSTPGIGMRDENPSEVPFLGRVSLTDAGGWYTFLGLSPGLYTIEPAFLPDDGYVNRTLTQVMVSSRDSVVSSIALAKGLKPLSPTPRGTGADRTPRFAWEAHPGAEKYEFWFSLGQIAETLRPLEIGPEAAFDLPDSLALPVGSNVLWWVEARRGETLVGGFEEAATFTVSP